jgi:hypothetical protein
MSEARTSSPLWCIWRIRSCRSADVAPFPGRFGARDWLLLTSVSPDAFARTRSVSGDRASCVVDVQEVVGRGRHEPPRSGARAGRVRSRMAADYALQLVHVAALDEVAQHLRVLQGMAPKKRRH